jgi:hypothetical protein
MKRLSFVLVLILTTGLLCGAAAHMAVTYNDTLAGFQSASENEGVGVVLDAGGDLPGMSRVTLTREGNNVTGGNWTLTILPPNADAAANERGKLSGGVTGGSLTFTPEGTLSAASSIQLTVQSGTGEYASVTSGTGTINLSSAADNPSQLTGTLVLNF